MIGATGGKKMLTLGFAGWLVAAALVAATATAEEKVEFYDVPDGARPHDVAPAPDGKVWYTAQRQGALGILDPATGAVEQVPLGEGSAPHGVIAGPDGKAWITDGGQNAIVSFDPTTREVTAYPLPEDAGYSNLNTAAFATDGALWFTGQNGIYGRLDPASGEMQVFDAPKGRGPYGITATPDGDIYYASLAGSYVGRIDPKTGAATVIEPPTPGQGARRVWSDSEGNVWVSEWNSGQVSRYTPASGAWQAWKLPGDDPKTYAVYVDEADIVWLSDFGANAVVRFDPKSETFTQFEGSAPGANVRQILGRPGEVWAPESGTDRLMVIRAAAR
jgi:virginiamycin B lyase